MNGLFWADFLVSFVQNSVGFQAVFDFGIGILHGVEEEKTMGVAFVSIVVCKGVAFAIILCGNGVEGRLIDAGKSAGCKMTCGAAGGTCPPLLRVWTSCVNFFTASRSLSPSMFMKTWLKTSTFY